MDDEVSNLIASRQGTHGSMAENSATIQAIKEIMRAAPNWAGMDPIYREALEMVAHKMGRILHGDPSYLDPWMDIAGYAQRIVETIKGRAP